MKILHVWDQAGIACILAKYQKKMEYETQVIKRTGFDQFGIFSFYKGIEIKSFFGKQFLRKVVKIAEEYEIIHIHDIFELVPLIKKSGKKKIVLHYHGTKLRNTPSDKRKKFEKDANLILVSTPDLTKFVNSKWLPNPVDIELFATRKISKNDKALSFMTKTESPKIIDELLKKNKISLKYETISRDKKPIQYKDMPKFLQNYEYLIDLKLINGKVVKAYSTLGLQALSLGLKVLNYNYEIANGLPKIHNPENVVKRLNEFYHGM